MTFVLLVERNDGITEFAISTHVRYKNFLRSLVATPEASDGWCADDSGPDQMSSAYTSACSRSMRLWPRSAAFLQGISWRRIGPLLREVGPGDLGRLRRRGRAHDHHRNRRTAQQGLRDRAERRAARAHAMRAHDDRVAFVAFRDLGQHVRGVA